MLNRVQSNGLGSLAASVVRNSFCFPLVFSHVIALAEEVQPYHHRRVPQVEVPPDLLVSQKIHLVVHEQTRLESRVLLFSFGDFSDDVLPSVPGLHLQVEPNGKYRDGSCDYTYELGSNLEHNLDKCSAKNLDRATGISPVHVCVLANASKHS